MLVLNCCYCCLYFINETYCEVSVLPALELLAFTEYDECPAFVDKNE
ncbi:hypothetical protein [Methanocella paludicola]|nr:hypothetical protein [Methanocella paludicola]